MATSLRSSVPRYIAAGIIVTCALLVILAPAGGRAAEPPKPPAAPATCPAFGVNLASGEFGNNLPGTYGSDYIYPGIDDGVHNNAWELDYFHGKGLNLIRLGVRWERLQHDLYGPLTAFDIGLIDQVLVNAAARGMVVIIVPHNEARRRVNGVDYLVGASQVPYAAFTDFWRRMAEHFAGHPGLFGYSLDNEPHDTGGLWVNGGAQAGINGVRMADMTAPILVPGDNWSGAWTWVPGNDPLRLLNDPAHNLLFDAHQYFDRYGSGLYDLSYDAQGAYPTLGVDRLEPFVNWLHTNNLRGMVTEYGVPNDDPRWLTLLDNALAYLEANSDVIAGGMNWAAGPWWPPTYRLSVEPTGTWPNVTDRPQMAVLAGHTGCSSTCTLTFADVPLGSTFYDYVQCLACRGVVGGYSCGGPGEPCPGTYYRPGNNVTRGQVSKIVAESAGFNEPIPSTQQTFADVPSGSTFALWVERLSSRGILGGYPCGGAGEPCVAPANHPYFRPNTNVTRGQLAKIVSESAGWTETPTGPMFADVAVGSTFYLYIARIASRGIVSGYPCGGAFEPCIGPTNRPYFRPNTNATRGQMSKIAATAFFPGCSTPAARR